MITLYDHLASLLGANPVVQSPIADPSHRSQLVEYPMDIESIYQSSSQSGAASTDSSVGITRMTLGPKGIQQIDPKTESQNRKRKPEPGRVGSDDSFEDAQEVPQANPTSNTGPTNMPEVPEQLKAMFATMMNRFAGDQYGLPQYTPGQGQPWRSAPNMNQSAEKSVKRPVDVEMESVRSAGIVRSICQGDRQDRFHRSPRGVMWTWSQMARSANISIQMIWTLRCLVERIWPPRRHLTVNPERSPECECLRSRN